jgi:hypothetical protein
MALRRILEAFEIAMQHLLQVDEPWALTGSANLFLQGVDIVPRDIDLISTMEGAYAIQEVLKDFVVEPIQFRVTGNLRSRFGQFVIAGERIEVFSDIQNIINGQWDDHRDWQSHVRKLRFRMLAIPALSLAYERSIYKKLMMADKVAKIDAACRLP